MDYLSLAQYTPELEHANSIAASFEAFDASSLSGTTRVDHATYRPHVPRIRSQLTSAAEIHALGLADSVPSYEFFFIYKHLVLDEDAPVPDDANKLRVSRSSFEVLATRLRIPPAFVFALSRHYLPNGRGSRKLRLSDGSVAFDYWYFLPIRVQVKVTRRQGKDAASEADDGEQRPGQMNPFHRLHLPAVKLSILRSCVAIFSRVQPGARKVTFMAVDFMHGRWPSVALEPQQRIDEVMQRAGGNLDGDGHFAHLVYLSSAVRWWTNALNSVNEQLIAHELRLTTALGGRDGGLPPLETELTSISRALHSIAAHLHRYLSELRSVQSIAADLLSHYECVHADRPTAEADGDRFGDASRSTSQVLSQIEATHDFAKELEKKTQNILALLFNRIQIDSAKASHNLAEEMKRDSVAMRSIAIVTMFFLPGATFAALLAMPFFSQDEWFSSVSKLWIWVVLTVPSTGACFVFYRIWTVKARRAMDAQDILLRANHNPIV